MANDIIIVNDGAYRWAADRQQLVSALESLGWKRVGEYAQGVAMYQEPEPAEYEDNTAAYTTLCGEVDSIAGDGASEPITDDMYQTAGRFDYRRDVGDGIWLLDG